MIINTSDSITYRPLLQWAQNRIMFYAISFTSSGRTLPYQPGLMESPTHQDYLSFYSTCIVVADMAGLVIVGGLCADVRIMNRKMDWLGITWMPKIRPILRNLQKCPNQLLWSDPFGSLLINLLKKKFVWVGCESIYSRIGVLGSLLISMDYSC